ncbi:MAG: nucleoside triphosphate pyrophosphatase [Pseudomonadales bacterium]
MQLILASSSRYRAALLERLGLPFRSRSPEVDETPLDGEAPRDLVARLAALKAEAGARNATEALVIGSDQVAELDGRILGKPGTAERARAQLAALSGREVVFHTGLCLFDTRDGSRQLAVVDTPVRFRPLTEDQIRDYVDRERPLDCAGAFKSEGLGIALFDRLGGTDPNALIGLPLIELCSMLARAGLPVLGR